MTKVEVPDESQCPRCHKSSRDGNCTCYSSGEFNDVMRQLRAPEQLVVDLKLAATDVWLEPSREEKLQITPDNIRDYIRGLWDEIGGLRRERDARKQVPCEGECGGTADESAYHHYCPACQEGAAILNENAIRLQRERADENLLALERIRGLYSEACVERDAAREEKAQVLGTLGNKMGPMSWSLTRHKELVKLVRIALPDTKSCELMSSNHVTAKCFGCLLAELEVTNGDG